MYAEGQREVQDNLDMVQLFKMLFVSPLNRDDSECEGNFVISD